MRKTVMLLLALAAIRLLPRTLRRQARTLELLTLLCQAITGTAANTSKAYATETRTGTLEGRVGTMQSQRGTTTAFSNLSQTETGSPQVTNVVVQTSGVQGATVSGSSVAQHTHSYGHFHYTQIETDYDTLISQLNTMRNALIAAGIL